MDPQQTTAGGQKEEENSSYLMHRFCQVEFEMMLNNITNDLDTLLSEFCHLSYVEPQPVPPVRNKSMRGTSKKSVPIENCSAFGGSSTSGTLTSTDSNHSNKVRSGTLTSTDSNNSVTKPRSTSVHSSHLDVFGLSSRPLEIPSYPEKQSCTSHSTSSSDLRQISCLERITKTHPIWFLPEVGRTGAVHLLKDKDVGIFVVRKSSHDHIMALSAQFPDQGGVPNVDHYLIEPGEYGLHLQGSRRGFSAIHDLIAHYCDNREDLPHRLVLPPAIRNAKTSQELNGLSMLGQAFWTSTQCESTSGSSSRSNLSEHSSMLNKSVSEPISIVHRTTGAITTSQSETTMQNSPPKHSVIDFSSYLIQTFNEVTDAFSHPANSLSVTDCVHSKCSVSEAVKHCDNLTGHVTQAKFYLHSQECSHSNMVLQNIQKEVDLNNSIDNGSRVSALYAKPKKNKSNLYSTTHLGLLDIPENLYFTSNLSDKLSDYEDIWKNNNSLPNNGSVQADIVSRLQPDLLHKANNSPTNSSPSKAAGYTDGGVSHTLPGNGTTHTAVVDPQLAVGPSSASSRTFVNTEGINITNNAVSSHDKHAFGNCISETTEVVHHQIVNVCETTEHNYTPAMKIKMHNKVEPSDFEVLNKELSESKFDPITEFESDLDTDSSHSDSYHSDDADADTEEGDVFHNNISVQTQTSPAMRCKPPPLQMDRQGSRKSSSNPSLSTLKSPVYSQPFDAINNVTENQKESVSKMPKKLRRRSAPVVGLAVRRLGTSHGPRLAPLMSPGNGSVLPAVCEGAKSCDMIDEAFQFLQGQVEVGESPEHVYEAAWVGGDRRVVDRLSPACLPVPMSPTTDKSGKVKPTPAPRKPSNVQRTVQQMDNGALSRKSIHEVANRIEKARTKQLENTQLNTRDSPRNVTHHLRDQLQDMEDFENSQVPSSPIVNKFPVENRNLREELRRTSCYDSSTAEDIITSWNPELTLRPLKPFPLYLQAGAMSEYDNLNSQSYMAPSINSGGTVFCKPWETSTFGMILNSQARPISKSECPSQPPPALPPPMDMHERIKAWQESSQNYHSVSTDIEDNQKRATIPDEPSVETKTISGEQSISDVRLSTNGHTSQSDRTLVNEKGTGHSKQQPSKCSEENIPLFGADFREKVVPILVNPRLLNQTKNRNPDCKIHDYILRLSRDRATTFGSTIENFIQCTVESQETDPFIVTRNIRQFMNGIKNYLVKHGEGELEDLIERERNKLGADEILNIDAILENSLHVCVIQPLKQNIYRLFVNEYTRNGNLKLLSSNIKYARTKTPEDIGIRHGLSPPDGPTLELIKQYLTRMQKTYSPLRKLENLLGATSTIYKFVAGKQVGNGSPSFGADDFLPILIYVLVRCGVVAVEIEADYMWGLLHPALLTGEGGYYLTSLSSAVLVLKNFRDMQDTRTSQQEGKIPSISDMQGFLKIAIPDELRDTIVWKTLPVRPNMTTKDICSMIAHNFKITNPQDYGLYTLEKGEECKLNDHECPQLLKADRLAHKKECFFAYKRCAANIAWPKSLIHS